MKHFDVKQLEEMSLQQLEQLDSKTAEYIAHDIGLITNAEDKRLAKERYDKLLVINRIISKLASEHFI